MSEDLALHGKLPFPVVGIGASAGGIEALNAFFNAMAADSGAAFVVIQHLPPDHESLMADILSRRTAMPVMQIDNGMTIVANQVYVTRPGHTVSIVDGRLHLGEPVEQRGHRRPIDDFFRSLAAEQHDKAIAVVLSGTGTNGTAGAQAIKAAGGVCLAQDPSQAAHAGMPTSLIHAGYADQVLKAEDIATVIMQYVRQPYLESDPERRAQAQQALLGDQVHLNEIRAILRTRTGHDFSGYKKPTLIRRIQRRMGLKAIVELKEYASLLRQNQEEVVSLANDLMISVTGFFRDPEAWEALRTDVVRPLIEKRKSGESIRAWTAACASGEEAYSLAMLIAEESAHADKHFEVAIFATDVAEKSLATARSGVYPGGIEGDVSVERLDRFFEKDESTYRVKKELREMIIFAAQNALSDPPFSRVDICCCRNFLIYLEPPTQRQLLAVLTFALREGGVLFLGNAETLGALDARFEVINKAWRMYRRLGAANPGLLDVRFARSGRRDDGETTATPNLLPRKVLEAHTIQQALLNRYALPSVVVDRREQAVYFHGDNAPFLIYPSGEPTRQIFDIVRHELRAPLRRVLRDSNDHHRAAITEAYMETPLGHARVDIRVTPLVTGTEPNYLLISFEILAIVAEGSSVAVPTKQARDDSGAVRLTMPTLGKNEVEEETSLLRIELENTIEAFVASTEELKSSNEEMTSINEELQSANEELESSQEELQSLNEELYTVNGQLQAKVGEVEAANNDLANLLSSTSIAVVFLDTELKVRRYTPAMSDLLELIPSDLGRPITDLALKTSSSDLLEDAHAVLEHMSPREREVQSFSGRWYVRRTLPYRTVDRRLDGIVITFIDVSARKQAEQTIEAAHERSQAIIEQMPAAVLIVEAPTGRLLQGNRQAAALFGHPYPLPFLEVEWSAAYASFEGFHADGSRYLAHEWPLARSLSSGETIVDEEIVFKRGDGTCGVISVSATPVLDRHGNMVTAVATFGDITARKQVERTLQENEERFRVLVNSAHGYAIFMLSPDSKIIAWNKAAEQVTGWSEQDIVGQSVNVLHTSDDRASGLFERLANRAIAAGKTSEEQWLVRRDGSRFWATGVLAAVLDRDGRLRCFVNIMQDRTEGKQMEERLQHAMLEAEQNRVAAEAANQTKDEFVAMVSHELRSPLNIISLWARMLDTRDLPEKQAREGIKMIGRAAHAQQQLIEDLLDVSRMNTGKLRLALRDTHLREAIETAIDVVRPAARARGINLECVVDDAVGIVRADPDRIQQVVVNLISNAVKFTPSAGQVRVTLQRNGDEVEISVADSGIGIRKDFLSRVFSSFSQAEVGSARKHSGLGLGLAIAKQIVELHHGTIVAMSEGEGLGATFTVTLPLPPQVGDASGKWKTIDAPLQKLDGINILLLDDEAPSRTASTQFLQARGAEIRAVESAAAAREAIAIRAPDIILSDIGLPGEDGYMFIRNLRETEASGMPRIPAIAVTAFARAEDRKKAKQAGFDGHVAKPIDPEQLIELLTKLVRGAQ